MHFPATFDACKPAHAQRFMLRGHVTLTHDPLAANTHEIKQSNGSKLMYLSFLCTCFELCEMQLVLWTNARHRKPVACNLYITEPVSNFGDVQGKGKGKGNGGWGGGVEPANNPCNYMRSVRRAQVVSSATNRTL
jgi:hypothetical protein